MLLDVNEMVIECCQIISYLDPGEKLYQDLDDLEGPITIPEPYYSKGLEAWNEYQETGNLASLKRAYADLGWAKRCVSKEVMLRRGRRPTVARLRGQSEVNRAEAERRIDRVIAKLKEEGIPPECLKKNGTLHKGRLSEFAASLLAGEKEPPTVETISNEKNWKRLFVEAEKLL